MASSPGNVNCTPYYLKTPDRYLVDQARMYHNEAIYAFGEYSMFILLWNITDYQAGTVGRCPWCYERGGENEIDTKIAHVYRQPAISNCLYCYGTTFFLANSTQLGGLKAKIVRPAMWNATDEEHKQVAQGHMITSTAEVQSVSDFRMRSGDYVFKADGTRWRVQPHETNSIISGFQASNDINAMIGYRYPAIVREDESSVAYLIPPDGPTLGQILDISVVENYPLCFEDYEVYNSTELVGDDYTPSPFRDF